MNLLTFFFCTVGILIFCVYVFFAKKAEPVPWNSGKDEYQQKLKTWKVEMTSFILRGLIPVVVCFFLGILSMFAMPKYMVWQQTKTGEAELARAEQNRQIAIQEAKAKEESAKSLANAEQIRAEGIASANKIIGDSLQNNDAYIHYLWIEALKESSNDVIYIPTEAGIPITESARFFKKDNNKDNNK